DDRMVELLGNLTLMAGTFQQTSVAVQIGGNAVDAAPGGIWIVDVASIVDGATGVNFTNAGVLNVSQDLIIDGTADSGVFMSGTSTIEQTGGVILAHAFTYTSTGISNPSGGTLQISAPNANGELSATV